MAEQDDPKAQALFADLTDKQREVLDLLLQHKTSKEIARRLDISPHTVDQRIQFAKQKLGANSRSEVAVAYRRLSELCGRMTYDDSGIAAAALTADGGRGSEAAFAKPPIRTRLFATPDEAVDYLVVQGMFDGRYGTLMRLGAIMAIAVLLTLLVLGALATLSQLSVLFAG